MRYKVVLTKFKELLPFCQQTYFIPFLWALTWYSFWIFRDFTSWRQINTINIVGAIISTCVIVSAIPIRNVAHKALNLGIQINKNIHWAFTSSRSQASKIIQILPTTFAPRNQTHHFIQIESHPLQTIRLNTQKQNPEPKQRAHKSQQPLSNTNGCPKNLDYYTQKPRPKQTPDECISCKNLITCVCQTSN